MRFAINKFFQFGLWCIFMSGAALAAPLATDPIFVESEGCLQSPLPHAPRDAMTAYFKVPDYSIGYGETYSSVSMRIWFQPCTVPKATLAYKSVLLIELNDASWSYLPDMARDYFNILENSKKIKMAFFSGSGRLLPGALLTTEQGTFLIKKEVNQGTANLDSSLITLDYSDDGGFSPFPSPIWGNAVSTVSGLNSPIPLANYTGPWWNPEEGGHGFVVSQDSANYLWLTWYSYDDQSEPLWYVSESTNIWTSPTKIEGALLRTRYKGRNALTGNFDKKLVTQERVGTYSLTFSDTDAAVFSYTVNGKTSTKKITRFKLN